jgi:septum formation protein
MPSKPIILASASPRRSDLLKAAGIPFRRFISRVTEKETHFSPKELVTHNAKIKARALSKRFPKSWILSADTLVALGNRIYGKPKNMADARRMLSELTGKTHRVVTGVCFMKGGRSHVKSVTTYVTFKKLSSKRIDRYLRKIHPLDKAGAYAAQEHTDFIIKRVRGSFTNVVGLPMETVLSTLKKLKVFEKSS